MLRERIAESLTARIFLITAGVLLAAGAITFSFIAWASPSTYTAVVNDDLTAQVDALVGKLAETTPADCGELLDEFVLDSGANAMLVGPDGRPVDTGAKLTVQAVYEDDTMIVTTSEQESAVGYHSQDIREGDTVAVTMSEQATITAEVVFEGQSESYTLYVTPRIEVENLAVRALIQMAPWLLMVLLVFSLLCAFIYSRYITRPIVRMSGIAGKMAELDFHWECGETRRDEIGKLGRSLDQLARRLDTALTDLENANQALRGEVERERELDRQRMAFFNAASHELKTPVTILKGQLSGMLEGVGVYQDRDKYLLRSLRVTGRMENLVQEMLAISRMESGSVAVKREPVELSRSDRAPACPRRATSGAEGAAAGKGPDAGNHCHRGRLSAGSGSRQSALQRVPLLAGRGGGAGVVRPAERQPIPGGGEHRPPTFRKIPCPICLRPSTEKRIPGTGPPRAAAWGCIW